MAIPDISNLTATELSLLSQQVAVLHKQTEAAEETLRETRRQQIQAAIASLDALLGPVGGPATLTSIRGVQAFTDAQMAANAGLAFRLVFQGMEILTKTTLDLAKVTATQ